MQFSDSFSPTASRSPAATWKLHLPKRFLAGRRYCRPLLRIPGTSSISIDESMVKSATQGVSMGVGVRVISG